MLNRNCSKKLLKNQMNEWMNEWNKQEQVHGINNKAKFSY